MADYSRHYAILSISPNADWAALRVRYKRLIGKWHPDRFPADTSERALAEERSKQITIAYRTIERYYRDHGVLPPLETLTTADRTGTVAEPSAAPEGAGQAATTTDATGTTVRQPAGRATGRRRIFLALCAFVLGAYIVSRHADNQTSEGDIVTAGSGAAEAPESAPPERDASRGGGGITVGSTLGEVYAIQGIPTLTQGDTWHYGKSFIRFEQGKAVSWVQHPDNPLRIARDQPVELRSGFFYLGSTKDEVRSIQGSPVSETETVWDYGPSRVYFEHNRVVRWETSPLQPLRVPH
jgi:DnaJ-like protein